MRVKSSRSSRIVAARLFTAVAAIVVAGALLGGVLASRGDAAAVISAKLVTDINPGSADSTPGSLTAIGNELFFFAYDSTHGAELWKTNGSDAGTVMVKDINPGSADGNPGTGGSPIAIGSELYFSANDGTHGYELWKSDGTEAGTAMVADINLVSGDSNPGSLTAIGGELYFLATDGTHGYELWKSDGTEAGTAMVADINPGGGDSNPHWLTVMGDTLYFAAYDGSHGTELWKSDGSGAAMVADIFPGTGGSVPIWLTAIGGNLYFSASEGTNGAELWKSDGVPVSSGGTTAMVKDIQPGGNSSNPSYLVAFNGGVYFCALDGVYGYELWKSDGTSGGTKMVKDINPDSADSCFGSAFGQRIVFNGALYFQATTMLDGYELWKSDGSADGTVMVKDINPSGMMGSYPQNMALYNGSLYFAADDGTHGYELWESDGTNVGTRMFADINLVSVDSYPNNLTVFGGRLYFAAEDYVNGRELWAVGDFSPPETTIDSGPSGTITSSSAGFAFSADEASTFQCALDGAAMSACTSPKALSGLANGSHTFQVQATDAVGNVDPTPASSTFAVNVSSSTTPTTPKTAATIAGNPQTSITKHPKKVVATSAATASASFAFKSSKAGSHFSCKLDKGKWASCRSPKAYKVKPGKHTFQVRATSAGKTDPTPAKWTWSVKRK